jgi:hypothetical protein
MTISPRWIWMLAACGAIAALTAQVRRKREIEHHIHKANLHEWENEGGNLAPAALPPTSR